MIFRIGFFLSGLPGASAAFSACHSDVATFRFFKKSSLPFHSFINSAAEINPFDHFSIFNAVFLPGISPFKIMYTYDLVQPIWSAAAGTLSL